MSVVSRNFILLYLDWESSFQGHIKKEAFFNANKDFIMANAKADTVRYGGLGGVAESLCYRIKNISVSLGGHTMGIQELTVGTSQSSTAADFNNQLGIKSLVQFDKIRFNLVDFVLTTYPQAPF